MPGLITSKISLLRKLRRASKKGFGTSLFDLARFIFFGNSAENFAFPNNGPIIVSRGSRNPPGCTILDRQVGKFYVS